MSTNKNNRSLWGSRNEAQRIYYQRQTIKRLEKENKELKEQCEKQRYAITENCDLRKQIDKLTQQKQELRNWLEFRWEQSQDVWFVKIINKLNELEGGNNE